MLTEAEHALAADIGRVQAQQHADDALLRRLNAAFQSTMNADVESPPAKRKHMQGTREADRLVAQWVRAGEATHTHTHSTMLFTPVHSHTQSQAEKDSSASAALRPTETSFASPPPRITIFEEDPQCQQFFRALQGVQPMEVKSPKQRLQELFKRIPRASVRRAPDCPTRSL